MGCSSSKHSPNDVPNSTLQGEREKCDVNFDCAGSCYDIVKKSYLPWATGMLNKYCVVINGKKVNCGYDGNGTEFVFRYNDGTGWKRCKNPLSNDKSPCSLVVYAQNGKMIVEKYIYPNDNTNSSILYRLNRYELTNYTAGRNVIDLVGDLFLELVQSIEVPKEV